MLKPFIGIVSKSKAGLPSAVQPHIFYFPNIWPSDLLFDSTPSMIKLTRDIIKKIVWPSLKKIGLKMWPLVCKQDFYVEGPVKIYQQTCKLVYLHEVPSFSCVSARTDAGPHSTPTCTARCIPRTAPCKSLSLSAACQASWPWWLSSPGLHCWVLKTVSHSSSYLPLFPLSPALNCIKNLIG